MLELGKILRIGSGALGTSLRRIAGSQAEPVELLNLKNPDAVRSLHAAYRDAGSDILVTNTFAANPIALGEAGFEEQCSEINAAGVRLASEAAGSAGPAVWASVGPLGLGLRLEDFSDDALVALYRRQCAALKGADALVLETFAAEREAAAALKAASETGLPVVFQIGNTGGGARRWERVDSLVSLAEQAGVVAVGVNCRHPDDITDVVRHIAARCSLPVTASPNAGHPRIERGLVIYEFTPKRMLETAAQLHALGVAVLGGCCGTGPEHIRALAAEFKGRPVAARPRPVPEARPAREPMRAAAPQPNSLRELIYSERFLVSVEIRADRMRPLKEIIKGAELPAACGADMFDVPDNPAATVGREAMVTAAALQEKLGVPAIPHMSVTQANMLKIHSMLIGCGDLGLKGVLAVTGDAPSMGHLGAVAGRVADLKSSVELLRLIRQLRSGKMVNGEEVADAPDLCAGCAVGRPTAGQIKWLQAKIEAGAEFVFSQPVFTFEDYCRLRDAVRPFGIRLFTGLMPVLSRRSAEFLASGRIPGISVPEEIVKFFASSATPQEQRRLGLEMACELASKIAADAAGLYIIMPFSSRCYEETAEIVRSARSARP